MALFILTSSTLTRTRMLTLGPLHLAVALAFGVGLLLAAGIALGYILAARAQPAPAALQGTVPKNADYLVDRLGVLSGRLDKLESDARQLGRRVDVLDEFERQAPPVGGPVWRPRSESSAMPDATALGAQIDAFEHALEGVNRQLAAVSGAAVQRNLSRLAFPSREPLPGAALGSAFGNRVDPFTGLPAFHSGLDFTAEAGTPIRAAGGGTVKFAGYNTEMGQMVEIDHGRGLITRYAHAARLLVRTGEVVEPGAALALVGSTGRSTGPHLHFEVLKDGQYVDPRLYLAVAEAWH